VDIYSGSTSLCYEMYVYLESTTSLLLPHLLTTHPTEFALHPTSFLSAQLMTAQKQPLWGVNYLEPTSTVLRDVNRPQPFGLLLSRGLHEQCGRRIPNIPTTQVGVL
jgi:hypothetical protein